MQESQTSIKLAVIESVNQIGISSVSNTDLAISSTACGGRIGRRPGRRGYVVSKREKLQDEIKVNVFSIQSTREKPWQQLGDPIEAFGAGEEVVQLVRVFRLGVRR